MEASKLFIEATKRHLRFPFKGSLTTEELWDLSVQDLDAIYKTLNAESKKASEESLLTTAANKDENLEIRIEILKFIVKDKQDAAERAKKASEKAAKRQELLALLHEKENAELNSKSIEEIKAMLSELD